MSEEENNKDNQKEVWTKFTSCDDQKSCGNCPVTLFIICQSLNSYLPILTQLEELKTRIEENILRVNKFIEDGEEL